MQPIETVNKANVLVDDEDVIGKVKNERWLLRQGRHQVSEEEEQVKCRERIKCKDCGGATSAPTAE